VARKQTGLRNRYRTGRSTYSIEHKSRGADRYGVYDKGRQSRADVIAGNTLPLHQVWRQHEIRAAELVF
jgi:hypothetical protein